jgi:hypothetical protein
LRFTLCALSFALLLADSTQAATGCDGVGNCYVRAGAAGSGNGSDWTNAYTDLPASLQRGTTYYVAAGTYPPHVFNDPDAGSALITVKAPTVALHGTDTGWNNLYQGQALWECLTTSCNIWDVSHEDDIVFDGSYCNPQSPYSNICTSGYGFKLFANGLGGAGNTGNDCVGCGDVLGGQGFKAVGTAYVHDLIFKYIEIEGNHQSSDTGLADAAFDFEGGSYNLYFGHLYLHHNTWQYFLRGNHAGSQGSTFGSGNNITIEYNALYWDYTAANPNVGPHGAPCSCSEGLTNFTWRYNLIGDMVGTDAGPDTASGADYNNGNGYGGPWYLYGNIWYADNASHCAVGDGIMAIYDFSMTNGPVYFYNNSIVNMGYPFCSATDETGFGLGLTYTTPISGWYEQNNLWYGDDLSQYNGNTIVQNGATNNGQWATFNPAAVHGYDAWFASPNSGANDSDTHKQVSTSNPFANSSSNNFTLASDTAGGTTLSTAGTYWNGSAAVANTFNVDMNGVTRGADGTWDRGALQLVAGSTSGCDGEGNCYIYASATGSGTGANWTNAYTGFGTGAHQINPAAMTRGVTYWIAAGNYGGVNFSAPDSGTSVITLEGATMANHGPASDWANSFAGQAVFGESTVSSDYWTFNGQTRGSDWRSGYNLKFWNQTDGAGNALFINGGTHGTIGYVEIEGTNDNYSGSNSDDGMEFVGANNWYVGYSWIHDVGTDLIEVFTLTGLTFEYNMFERNHTGLDSNHSQAMDMCGLSNLIIRYNYFRDITNTAVIDTACGSYVNESNWYIYGNVNYWTSSVHLTGTSGQADGFVALFGEILSGDVQIYNNTFANINGSACANSVICNTAALWVCGSSCGGAGCTGGNCGSPTVTVYNNLWYNPYSGQDIFIDSAGSQWTATGGYGQNYCPSGGCSNGGGFASNVNGATNDASSMMGNPFVNFDGSSNFNFALNAATSAGLLIPNGSTTPEGCTAGVNCFNIDPAGAIRGADGDWDRGAYEYCSGGTCVQAPPPPVCGDGICNGGETCSSCPSDCGACPAPPTGGTGTTVSNLSAVQVYPNPWRSDKHNGFPITFAQLPTGSTIKIFTASGHIVKTLSTQTSVLSTWDLTNDSGDKVASGVYIYLITDSQGDKVRGKVAVIK